MDALCQRWHVLPSQVLAEPSGLVYGIIAVIEDGDSSGGEMTEDDEMKLALLDRIDT